MKIAGLEMKVPSLPRELMEETGRWNPWTWCTSCATERLFRPRLHPRGYPGRTSVRRDIRSWRDLPLLVYQMQTKFRDEPRPRGGLLRVREFIMFDGYSFDRDEAALDVAYKTMTAVYENTFRRCGVEFLAVEADAGDIGGTDNHEFMVLSPSGEDSVLRCEACGYAANAERCPVPPPAPDPACASGNGDKPLEIVSTPGVRTVDEVAGLLGTSPACIVKTLLFLADDAPVAALVRGDRDINEIKLAGIWA